MDCPAITLIEMLILTTVSLISWWVGDTIWLIRTFCGSGCFLCQETLAFGSTHSSNQSYLLRESFAVIFLCLWYQWWLMACSSFTYSLLKEEERYQLRKQTLRKMEWKKVKRGRYFVRKWTELHSIIPLLILPGIAAYKVTPVLPPRTDGINDFSFRTWRFLWLMLYSRVQQCHKT